MIVKDRTTKYAKDVVAGKIIAGPHVRAACKRHLKDLETAEDRGFVFDVAKADRFYKYCANVLKLNGGKFEGKPFLMEPWQCFLSVWLSVRLGPKGYRLPAV